MKRILHCTLILYIAFTTIGFAQVDLGDDVTTCEGETVVLDATTQNATSYQWSLDGQVLVNEVSAVLFVTQGGVYEVTAIISGMPATDSVLVTFNPTPAIGNITDLLIEAMNGVDFGTFDLTTKIPEITNGNANLSVTFYETLADAQTDINNISSPNSYVNIINPQEIFVRVQDLTTSCSSIASFTLVINNFTLITCNASPQINTFCYGNFDQTAFAFQSDSGAPITVEFLAGEVENIFDELVIYDGNITDPILYSGYGNDGDLTGLSFQSTGGEITIQIQSDGSIACSTNSFEPWQFTASCLDVNTVGIINVNSFLDDNNNGAFDTGEVTFPFGNIVYEVNDNGEINVGSSDGNFFIVSDDATNSYDVTFSLFDGYENCYNVTTPTINDVSVAIGQSVTLDFPVTQQQACEDLEVILINPSTPPRPGFTYENILYLNNLTFSTIASGTVEVIIDDDLVLNGVANVNSNYIITNTATGFTVDFVNLPPLASEAIEIQLLCPVSVPLGDIVSNTATYTTTTNDFVPGNNSATLREVVIGSWDPNDIRESRGREIIFQDFTANDYLYYTIRFQNLGTADAINVRIEETLDTKLDETTFQMLASSHAYQVQRVDGDLIWTFDNINLPAEMFDAEGSNGFVYFKIKPQSGYAIGDIIPAVAGIYFDFNAPVITNIFETEFVEPLSVNEIADFQVKLYPNPATDILYIELEKSELIRLQLVDIHGKQILTKTATSKQIELNISNLKSGMYFLKLSSNTARLTKKITVK
ncbi:hypothetical protein KORDIASMS9_00476 [Kordia sp. SMS9]|uniref:T9SS type A sorting domain-containing protein n=1 Tax=Kordia sp. SMS9 TaxID=2282170 RepID=UPI000E0CC625|nr:T9SS type A sorting domain-containing protein [Kordia sp. SMS9]AXG68283.1 hypothetical protein KORDIASMS9_00476 [Kordia sp. SMS9]